MNSEHRHESKFRREYSLDLSTDDKLKIYTKNKYLKFILDIDLSKGRSYHIIITQ